MYILTQTYPMEGRRMFGIEGKGTHKHMAHGHKTHVPETSSQHMTQGYL